MQLKNSLHKQLKQHNIFLRSDVIIRTNTIDMLKVQIQLKLFIIPLLCLFLFACADDEEVITQMEQNEDGRPDRGNNNGNNNNNNELSALPTTIPDPTNNVRNAQKVALGKALFWDPILSGNMDVACGTCHHPARGYSDGIDLSIGVGGIGFAQNRRVGALGFADRNSPTILNTAFNGIDENGNVNPDQAPMFWDNRADGLEEQSLLPIHSFVEMRGNAFDENQTMDVIIQRLQDIAEYRQLFSAAFGNSNITETNISRAIAAFERTLVSNNSPFDQFMRGNTNVMNNQQIEGMNDFIRVGCVDCHSGPMLSDFELHTLGVRENNKRSQIDRGAGNFDFRTPSLRNLSFTAPYMHNGELNSLQAVLDFYDDNNEDSQNPNVNDNQLDIDLRNLNNLNRNEKDNIIAFLRSLDDPEFDRAIPTSVPSGLNPGGNIN